MMIEDDKGFPISLIFLNNLLPKQNEQDHKADMLILDLTPI